MENYMTIKAKGENIFCCCCVIANELFVFQTVFFKSRTKIIITLTRALISRFLIFVSKVRRQKSKFILVLRSVKQTNRFLSGDIFQIKTLFSIKMVLKRQFLSRFWLKLQFFDTCMCMRICKSLCLRA